MREMGLAAEFRYFAVYTHQSAGRAENISPEVIKHTPLKIELPQNVVLRRADGSSIDASLLRHFKSACKGTNGRWVLASVFINPQHIILSFVDKKSQDKHSGTYSAERIVLSDPTLLYIEAVREDDGVSDRFEVHFKTIQENVLSITEHKGGVEYRHSVVRLEEDGKFYVIYSCYD